jgi:hypothetical protein
VLRTALKETLDDPAFLSDAKKTKIEVEYVSDSEIVTVLKRLYATPKEKSWRGSRPR